MRMLFALLFTVCSLSVFDAKAQETGGKEKWVAAGRQVIDYLVDKHVDYNVIYDARDFGLPAPDSLHLKTADGFGIFAYEICPEQPKGVVICLSGIENPSVTAFYGHATEFIKADVATIMPDLRGHGKSDGNRICLAYEETRDVKAVTDYLKSNAKYKDVPVIVMGVSMGAAVAIRSIGENKDIDGLISLSAFSSLEDFLQAGREAFLPMIPATELDGVTRHVVKEKYGVDASVSSPVYALCGLNNRPVLMMHSRKDTQVPYSCFEKLSAEASKYTIDLDTMTVEGDEHFICKDFIHPSSDREYMRRLMRFIRKLTSNHPYVKTEEGVELMEIVARFADNTVFNDSIAPRYQKDCDEWFAAWRNHPAVEWLHNQLPIYSIGYEAVPWFGAHLLCKEDGLDLIPNANKEYKRWPRKAIKEFLPLLTDFYLKSNFSEFYRQHSQMYKKAVDAARVTMADYVDLDWFGSFFKKEATAEFGIIVGLNNGSGSFSIERTKPGERPERIAVMLYGEYEDGTPWYFRDSEIDKILVHEFCHSFISPDKKYKKIGTRLLNENRKKLNSVGYGIWENVIEETLVRASVIRYLIDHGYSDEVIKEEISNQHEYYGFTWLPKDIEWYKGDVLEIFDKMCPLEKQTTNTIMKFEIIENEGLELIGIVKKIEMKKGAEECPAFWKKFSEQLCIPMMQAGKPLDDKQAAVAENNIGEYALCDCDMAAGTFDYFISGSYKGGNVPEGMEVRKVEYKKWLKFYFEGGMAAFHNNYTYVYNEWLQQHPEYKAVMAVNVEWYTMGDFNSPDYQCGVMIPVLDNSQKN